MLSGSQHRMEIVVGGRDTNTRRMMQGIRGDVRGLGRDLEVLPQVLNRYEQAGRVAMGVGLGMGAALAVAGREAIQFDTRMREVQTVVKAPDLSALKDSVISLTGDPYITAMPEQLAAGLYEVGSAGRAAAEGEQSVLRAGARLAQVARSEQGPTLNLLVRLMRAYGLENEAAADVTDDLFTVVEEGLPKLNQWNTAIAKGGGISASAGIEIEEMLASLTALSDYLSTDQSGTAYERLVNAFLNPSDKFREFLKGVGYDAEVGVRSLGGFVPALRVLQEYTEGNAAKLAELGLEEESFRAALFLTANEGERVNAVLARMHDNTGAVEAGLKALVGAGHAVQKLWQQIDVAGKGLGESLSGPVETVAGAGAQVLTWVNGLPGPVKAAVVAVTGLGAAWTTAAAGETLLRVGIARMKGELMAMQAADARYRGEVVAGTNATRARRTEVTAEEAALREVRMEERAETTAVEDQTRALIRNTKAIDQRLAMTRSAGGARNMRLMARTGVVGGGTQDDLFLRAMQLGDDRAFWAQARHRLPSASGARAVSGRGLGMGRAAGMADMAGTGMMMFGGPGMAQAGMGVSMLGQMAPQMMSVASVLLNPATVAAVSAGVLYYGMYHEMVVKARRKLEETEKNEVAQARDAERQGMVTERDGQRLSAEKAARYDPQRSKIWSLWLGKSDTRLLRSMREMDKGEQDEALERIKIERGEDAYNWFAMRMSDVSRRRLSVEEQLAEEQPETRRAWNQEQREAAMEAGRQRQRAQFAGEGAGAQMPAPGGEYGKTINLQLNVNDGQTISDAVYKQVREFERGAFPSTS